MTLDRTKYKYCPTCGEYRPVAEFHRDRTRSNGLQSTCKQCRRESRAERQRLVNLPAGPDTTGGFVRSQTEEVWLSYHGNRDLHRYINTTARGFSKRHWEDLKQEAWIYISLTPPGLNLEALQKVAYNAMQRTYRRMKLRRENHLTEAD